MPLFSKIVSTPSIVSAVTPELASDFGGHFGGHFSMAVSKVSAIFVSGADTSDTLDTSGRDKGDIVFISIGSRLTTKPLEFFTTRVIGALLSVVTFLSTGETLTTITEWRYPDMAGVKDFVGTRENPRTSPAYW